MHVNVNCMSCQSQYCSVDIISRRARQNTLYSGILIHPLPATHFRNSTAVGRTTRKVYLDALIQNNIKSDCALDLHRKVFSYTLESTSR